VAKLQNLPLTIATTHLTTDTIHNLTPKNKRYNLIRSQILQAAAIFAEKEHSVILTGDFNTAKESMLYTEFLHATGATDTFARFEDITYSPERTPYRFHADVASRIDYIFYKENAVKIRPTEHEHVFTEQEILSNGKKSYLSDHIGLSTTLNLI
jgi:endonuclease/exonuclease/phosphatase family metal-dependent hydrolase